MRSGPAEIAAGPPVSYTTSRGTIGLNFGDCFAYALARQHSAPLLYVGNDFVLTDIQSALAS